MIGALETISKIAKAWYGRLTALHFLEVHSCQPSLVLLISCGKCCVCKLREAAETCCDVY